MASSNKTDKLQLPQWQLNEKPEMEDFNGAFDKIEDFKDEFDTHKAESSSKHIHSSGSNDDGYYTKFDDGTLICTHALMTTSVASETFGALFFVRYPQWNYPASFIANPAIGMNNIRAQAQITACRSAYPVSTGEFYGYRGTDFSQAALDSAEISLSAIGRWK